jgi:hypothetical protein
MQHLHPEQPKPKATDSAVRLEVDTPEQLDEFMAELYDELLAALARGDDLSVWRNPATPPLGEGWRVTIMPAALFPGMAPASKAPR